MRILCDVDQAECLRHGIDAPSSTVKIEVDPKSLTQEQRELVASELHSGLRFPRSPGFAICPPTYEGFMATVKYLVEDNKRGEIKNGVRHMTYNPDETKKFAELRQSLIKAAVAESERREKVQGTPDEIGKQLTQMARPILREQARAESEKAPAPFRRSRGQS